MTDERLKEIKDSIETGLTGAKLQALNYAEGVYEDALELYNEVIRLKEENEKIRKQNLYEHKYGSEMEGKYIVEKSKNDKAIEYIEECYTQPPNIENFMHEGEMNYLLNILRGEDK